ncbi:MAG: hypothetical protein HFH68_09715 [Lachnospiraceae bacterium]|nr:hypothetical protein [Lachnospiraceae bacterium]
MADLSAIGALSSLSEKDLYYQYLINNNPASNMFKALAGNNTQDSYDGLGLSGLMGTISQAGSLSGLSSLLGSSLGISGSDGLGSLGMVSSFSSILKLYLNAETSEAGNMAQELSEALEEADAAGESATNSYKTVQEIYQYFLDKSSLTAQALKNNTSSGTAQAQATGVSGISGLPQMVSPSEAFEEFDFDGYISNIESGLGNV